jgi:hypothetical protein
VSAGLAMGEVIYEFSIHELSKFDHRWGDIWTEFLLSCTTPTHPLPPQNHQEFLRNKTLPPKIFKDTVMEIWLKVKNRINHNRVHMRGRRAPDEGDNEDGWVPSHGKYSRQYNAVSSNDHITRILQLICQIFSDPHIPHRGNFYYPPNGYREWHTNQFDPFGWRLYLIHTNPTGCSLFRYHLPSTPLEEIKNAIDHDGMIRLFKIPDRRDSEALWHSIVSDGQRWSLGVMLSDQSARQLIEFYDPHVSFASSREGGDAREQGEGGAVQAKEEECRDREEEEKNENSINHNPIKDK